MYFCRGMAASMAAHYAQSSSVYKTVVRPVLMYVSEIWALRKAEQTLLERTEMRMLRWMMGIKSIEKIGNEEIRARAGVANITKKIRVTKLRWLVHVERNTEGNLVMRTWKWVDTEMYED